MDEVNEHRDEVEKDGEVRVRGRQDNIPRHGDEDGTYFE